MPVLRGSEGLVARAAEPIHEASPLPPGNPAGVEECCFASIRATKDAKGSEAYSGPTRSSSR